VERYVRRTTDSIPDHFETGSDHDVCWTANLVSSVINVDPLGGADKNLDYFWRVVRVFT